MPLSDLQSTRLIAFSEGPIVRSLSSSRHIFVLYFSVLIFLSDAIYFGGRVGAPLARRHVFSWNRRRDKNMGDKNMVV